MQRSRRHVLLSVGAAVAVAAGFVGGTASIAGPTALVQQTDAAWTTQESGVVSASAGYVAAPLTTCDGNTGGSPHVLRFDAAEEGVEVSAYRVTVMLGDGDDWGEEVDDVPAGWATGATPDGASYIAANTPTVVSADTTALAWGIGGGWSSTWRGTATVTALGPGGWESDAIEFAWSIGYDLLGMAYSSCTAS
ncbi:hypothetical protein [Microbacterium sp. G2-8]|uniref:hypothetical protein n=1 Tax=Microbacterium sp. G2-8 TaxID=2842454 RepID=UPI001C8A540F|nr:hypothetical protein [Microbacterium sp. G2-8]